MISRAFEPCSFALNFHGFRNDCWSDQSFGRFYIDFRHLWLRPSVLERIRQPSASSQDTSAQLLHMVTTKSPNDHYCNVRHQHDNQDPFSRSKVAKQPTSLSFNKQGASEA
jgi:hypothetical protein